jgi:hypothetical protein
MALATVLASLLVLARASFGRIAAATLCGALAAACLQNGLIALIPLFVAVFLGRRAARGGLAGPLACAAAAVVAALAIALPFYPGLPYVDASGLHMGSAENRAHRIPLDLGNAVRLAGLRQGALVLWAHDPVLAVLGAAGALLGLLALVRRWRTIDRARRLELAVVGAYVLPYLAVLAPNPFVFERFMLPMLPYLALLAGWLVASAVASLPAWLGALVAAACLAPPAYVAVRYDRVAVAPDRMELVAAWIRENVDPKSLLVSSPGLALPFLYDPAVLATDLEDRGTYTLPWLAYQGALPAGPDPERRWRVRVFPAAYAVGPRSLAPERVEPWLLGTDPDYVVLEASRYMRKLPAMAALEASAQRRGDLVFRASGQMTSFVGLGQGEYQAADEFALWLLDADAFGPDIDVYRIRRDR